MQQVVVLRRGSDARLAPLAGRRAPVTQASRRSRRPRRFAAHACTGRGRRAHVPYAETSGGVKALVAGLTGALNALAGVDAQAAQRAAEELARGDTRPPLDPQEVLELVREDYEEREYLWTGNISEELFAYDCRYTDPTLSFVGLRTFQRNMQGLVPWVERLVVRDTRRCELLGEPVLDKSSNSVTARWRMVGDLKLFWKPRIDVVGRTVFTYGDLSDGGRVYRYDETWATAPSEALMQLLRPRRGD